MSDGRPDGHERRRKQAAHTTASKLDIDYLLNSRPPSASTQPSSSRSVQPSRASSSSSHAPQIHIHHDSSKRKSKDRPFECEICGFSFSQRSDRNKHIRTVHLGERPFTCSYCSQTFGEKGNLWVTSLFSNFVAFQFPLTQASVFDGHLGF